jgi:hypothetical protein
MVTAAKGQYLTSKRLRAGPATLTRSISRRLVLRAWSGANHELKLVFRTLASCAAVDFPVEGAYAGSSAFAAGQVKRQVKPEGA